MTLMWRGYTFDEMVKCVKKLEKLEEDYNILKEDYSMLEKANENLYRDKIELVKQLENTMTKYKIATDCIDDIVSRLLDVSIDLYVETDKM